MRIVAGTLRGRPLATPETNAIRPTSDRVREALFNILAHGIPGFDLAGIRVLDLFAGTGALGIEALSRGAAFCLFVEQDAAARALIRRNIETFELTGMTRLYRRDVTQLGEANKRDASDLVFLDPPYGKGLAEQALAGTLCGGWLNNNAITVIEERADIDISLPPQLTPLDQRRYGETQVLIARYSSCA